MLEEKKVLLVKVDTLKSVVDAVTKSMSTEKFYWCRETMGIAALDQWPSSHVAPCVERKNKWENVGCVLYSFDVSRGLGQHSGEKCSLHGPKDGEFDPKMVGRPTHGFVDGVFTWFWA